jgi:hypothetical protein
MTLTATPKVETHRPGLVITLITILFFLGITALAGGIALTFGLGTEETMLSEDWLAYFPLIDSWVIPGLVLGIGFGLGSLFTGYGVLRRPEWLWARFVEEPTGHHWAWLATILLGLGHVIWIGLEFIYLPDISWLMVLYGPIGMALLLLPLTRTVSGYLRR